MHRLVRWLGGLLVLVVIAAVVAWLALRPRTPEVFYTWDAALPAQPGALLRQEPFERGLPAGARAWRILYTTTDAHGAATLASAVVMLARNAPPGPRPVVAWTHGTTGAVPGCGPSLLDKPFANVPGLAGLIERGWLLVATDYAGLGTAGTHPYLIGEGEARSALDALRAARRMREVQVGERTVVWGHSQGGHAAMWTGIVAPTYAPDIPIAGVAAAAPASDLRALIEAIQHTVVGRIMTSYVMHAYAGTYPDVRWDDYVTAPLARWAARDMASRCLAGSQAIVAVVDALALGGTIFGTVPTSGAFGDRLAQNTPDRPVPQPLLVAQDETDVLVLPQVQTNWVARRCAAGQALDYRRYAGRDHLTLVAPDSPFDEDLLRWTEARFANAPAQVACPNP